MWRYDHDLLLARTDYKPLDLGNIIFFSLSYDKLKYFYFSIYCYIFSYFPPDHFYNIIFIPPELSITGKSFLIKRTRFFQKTSTWILSTVALGWLLRSVTSLQVSPFHEEKNNRRLKSIKEKYRLRRIGLLGGGRILQSTIRLCNNRVQWFWHFFRNSICFMCFGLALKS
jgi:hypothetical protein